MSQLPAMIRPTLLPQMSFRVYTTGPTYTFRPLTAKYAAASSNTAPNCSELVDKI